MVLLAEQPSWPLRRIETRGLPSRAISFSVSVDFALVTAATTAIPGREASGGEEVRRRVEALWCAFGDEPVIHRVLGDLIVIIGSRPSMPGSVLLSRPFAGRMLPPLDSSTP